MERRVGLEEMEGSAREGSSIVTIGPPAKGLWA